MHRASLVLAASLAAAACGGGDGEPINAKPTIRFLHTFDSRETELFNQLASERGLHVETELVPFARGQQVIATILRIPGKCPDLIRIDATWLPALVAGKLLRDVPQGLVALDWTPEAASLAHFPAGDPVLRAVPQSVDGLVVVRDRALPAPASDDANALVAAARAAKRDRMPYPLGVRLDGYWLVPWLRAAGADLEVGAAGNARAIGAVYAFTNLFGDLAPPPPSAGSESPEEVRRWTAREVAYWVTGPWQLGTLPDRDRIAVSALAHAPRGGQLLVVPTCSEHPDDGWALARELVDVKVAARFAELATVPTRTASVAAAPPLVQAIAAALRGAEPMPRAPITPLLFDDLNPALVAVAAHDATVEEAMAGVARGWARVARAGSGATYEGPDWPPHPLPKPELEPPDPAPAGVFP